MQIRNETKEVGISCTEVHCQSDTPVAEMGRICVGCYKEFSFLKELPSGLLRCERCPLRFRNDCGAVTECAASSNGIESDSDDGSRCS